MVEYTWDDIIINPNDERLKDAINKECYFSNQPNFILVGIDKNYESKLINVYDTMPSPFESEDNSLWNCIVIKKEDPKKYVPFDTIEEFIKASLEHNKNHVLSNTGIWLKETSNNDNEHDCMFTINCFDMDNNTVHSIYSHWNLEEVLKLYKFLDDTPCGKLKEFKDAY